MSVSVFHNTFSEVRGNRNNGLFFEWSLGGGLNFLSLIILLRECGVVDFKYFTVW